MPMLGDRLDVVVGERIEMPSRLPLVKSALDHVIEVGNHAGCDEGMPEIVEVDAPWIAGAMGKDLELFLGGMPSPDARVQLDPLRSGRPRRTDVRIRENALAAVEPSIGTPIE